MASSSDKKSYNVLGLIISIVLFIIGIALIANPVGGMEAIMLVLGIVLIVYGAIMIFMALGGKAGGSSNPYAIPVVAVILGILLIIFRSPAAGIVLPLIIGIWAIVTGVMGLFDAMKVRDAHGSWRVMMITSLIAIVLGIIVLVGMGVGGNALGVIIGVCMLLYAIANIVNWCLAFSARRKNHL